MLKYSLSLGYCTTDSRETSFFNYPALKCSPLLKIHCSFRFFNCKKEIIVRRQIKIFFSIYLEKQSRNKNCSRLLNAATTNTSDISSIFIQWRSYCNFRCSNFITRIFICILLLLFHIRCNFHIKLLCTKLFRAKMHYTHLSV